MYLNQLLSFVVTVLCLGGSKCDSFFVSNQYNENKYYCVTNTSFALSWIHEDKQESSVSSNIPTTRGSVDCNFTQKIFSDCYTYSISDKWKLSNSLHENLNEVILDQRWEGIKKCFLQEYSFLREPLEKKLPSQNNRHDRDLINYYLSNSDLPTIKTEFVSRFIDELKYKPVLSTLREDFEIPFSIRSDRESHIFLCDGDYPPEANCYWFMLQAWNGEASAIRKCRKGYIPRINALFPKEPCRTPLTRISHQSVPPYLFSSYWTHFKIIKNNNNLSLIQVPNGKKILEWTENSTLVNVTHMIIHSKMANAFWKFHKIEFYYTKEIITHSFFWRPIQPDNGTLCISMFLKMCKSCQLKLALEVELFSDYTVKIEENIYKNSHTDWSEIKLVAYVGHELDDKYYDILISTIGNDQDRFWAISKVRQCQNKEFRMISTKEKVPCQLMSKNYNAISFDNSKLDVVVNDNCSENTIGEFCVPCNLIYDECKKISICSKDEKTDKQRCYCSPGYINYGQCYYECDPGRYGHGCTKNCSNCGTKCNVINGTCTGICSHYYFTGPKCNILKAAIFAKPPEVANIKYTEATVQVNNFQLQNLTELETISYTIQIKLYGKSIFHKFNDWTNIESNIKFNVSKPVIVTDLKPGATYFVRGVINIKNRDESYNGDRIPLQRFTTKCEDIHENSLKLIPFNTSVQIITQQDMDLICETIINIENQTRNFNNNTIFKNLVPFTNYTIEIQTGSRKAKSIPFRTTEGKPNPISDLLVYSKNESTISLRWRSPYPPTGILEHYKIEYIYYNKSIFTNETNTIITGNDITCKLWPNFHCAKLTNLGKNTEYTIMVYAKNKVPDEYGKSAKIVTTTTTEKSEAPDNLKFSWTMQNDLEVEWKHPIKSNGVIQYFQITLDNHLTRNKLTKEYHVTEETYQLNYTYTINSADLQPTTKYTVTVTAYNGYFGEDSKNETDESPPDIPSFKKTPQFFNATNTTITVNIQAEKLKDTQKTAYFLFLLISDENSNLKRYPELNTFMLINMRVVCKLRLENFTQEHSFTIGNQSDVCDDKENPPLEPQSFYNVTLILTNTFQSKTRYIIYSKLVNTTEKDVTSTTSSSLLALLSLLLIIPSIAVFFILKRNKKIEIKNRLSDHNDSSLQQKNMAKHEISAQESPLNNFENAEHSQVITYENTGTISNIFSKKISLQGFYSYVKKSEINGEFDRQHATILLSPTRKIYETTLGCQYFDYIDMEFINGSKIAKAYIAAETPKWGKINDFWKTIWDEKVKHILLFDNAETNTIDKYWPENTAIMICHGISLQVAFSEDFPNYKCRSFILIFKKEIRQVDQIHFRNCEQNIEKYVSLFKKLSKIPLNSISPTYVHCSAGIRGTGFILLCDMSLRMAAEENAVDVLRNLQRLNDHNSALVEDLQQYKLAHFVISEYLAIQKLL